MSSCLVSYQGTSFHRTVNAFKVKLGFSLCRPPKINEDIAISMYGLAEGGQGSSYSSTLHKNFSG